jgi:hypothetical protein
MDNASFRGTLFLFGYRFIKRRTCRKQLFRSESRPIKSGHRLRSRFRRILAGRLLLRRADWDDRGLLERWLTSCDDERGSSDESENDYAAKDPEQTPVASSLRVIIGRSGSRPAVGYRGSATRTEARCRRHRSTALHAIHLNTYVMLSANAAVFGVNAGVQFAHVFF